MTNGNQETTEPTLVFLVDPNHSARRRVVVEAARDEIATQSMHRQGDDLTIAEVAPDDKKIIGDVVNRSGKAMVLVVVNERELAALTKGQSAKEDKTPWVACASIKWGYDLLDNLGEGLIDIYFVVREAQITGVDILSLLLSGARGVIGYEAIGCIETIKAFAWSARNRDLRYRTLIGHPAQALRRLIDSARINQRIAESHWDLLLALATVPGIRFSQNANIPSQSDLARELSALTLKTGYVPIKSTYRQIGQVFEIVREELTAESDADELEEDKETFWQDTGRKRALTRVQMLELPYLPLYARMIGFPERLIPIRGVGQTMLTKRLYKGLWAIEFDRSDMFGDVMIARVIVPKGL